MGRGHRKKTLELISSGIQKDSVGTFLAAFQWLRLNAPRGFHLRLGNKIAHAVWAAANVH